MKINRMSRLAALTVAGVFVCVVSMGCGDDSGTSCVPTAEQCNGLDDDCNGLIDDGLERDCVDDNNISGTQECDNGEWQECQTDCVPQPEECNGIDDDCDGETDEGGSTGQLRRACETDCGSGYEYCFDGQWEDCDAPEPETEVCDGIDNDCNGETDEVCDCIVGEKRPCGISEGVCQLGQEECVNGEWSGDCVGGVEPADDDSNCNGLDDDCDGETDEDCTCTVGTTQDCGTNDGECETGTQSCLSGGVWGDCLEAVGPEPETDFGCDGLDNDCDGETDEDLEGDIYETNDTCAQSRAVPGYDEDGVVWEDDPAGNLTATVYPESDVDWYHFVAKEVAHVGCGWGTPQCFEVDVFFTLPPDLTQSDVLVTVVFDDDGDCTTAGQEFSSDSSGVWEGDEWSVGIQWSGECDPLFSDDYDIFIKVEDASGSRSCEEYTLEYQMVYISEGSYCS